MEGEEAKKGGVCFLGWARSERIRGGIYLCVCGGGARTFSLMLGTELKLRTMIGNCVVLYTFNLEYQYHKCHQDYRTI